jgi:predicted DCC family thiol-disulfide oxidoreductase YuxK
MTSTIPVVQFTVRGETLARERGRPYTCVYDGTCNVCTRLANALRRWDRDGRIEVVPSQAPGVTARFPWIPARAYAEALQLIGPAGQTWQGAAAVEELLNILPRGRLVSWLFRIPLVRVVANRTYKWFARNRYRLGCGEHCQSRPLDVDFRDN